MKITALLLISALALTSVLAGCSRSRIPVETPEPTIMGNTNLGAPREDSYAADDVFSLNFNRSAGFNPITTTSGHNILITPLMYEPLFEVDENMTAQPVLCKSWYSTEMNGVSVWFFTVDTERKMHDGSNFNAYDANYSIRRAQQNSKYRDRLSIIIGISALSETDLAITLAYENTQFPNLLNIPIMKDGTGDQFAPPGTGPYMMAETEDKLVHFADYPSQYNVPIDVIHLLEYERAEDLILAYEDAEIDLVTNDPTGMSNLGYGSANEIRDFPTTNMHYLGFNMEKATGYRTAFSHIINRSYITSDLMGGRGVPITLPILPTSPYYNAAYARLFDFSLEKFEEALAVAGIADHDDDGMMEYMITGIPVEMNINFIVNNESAVKVAAARDIAYRLRSVGITVTLRELPFSEYMQALKDKDFDMFYAEVKLPADFNLLPLLSAGGSLNYGKANDSSYENHIREYLAAAEDGRKLSADLMLRYVTSTAPIIPIAFEKREVLTHSNVVTGIRPTQYNVFHHLTDWNINLASNPYYQSQAKSEENGE